MLLPLLFLLPIFSYGAKTTAPAACAGPIANIKTVADVQPVDEIVHLGQAYFLTGGQNGPYQVNWQLYVGKTVEVQVDKKSDGHVEKNPQKVIAVGGSDPDALPATLVNTIRADATFLLPGEKPLVAQIIFNDVIAYAAQWDGKWHRSKPISVNEHNIELLNQQHSLELDRFLSEALDQKASRFAVVGLSANATPIMRETNLNSVVEQLRAVLSVPVAGYFIPWRPVQSGTDVLFLKAD